MSGGGALAGRLGGMTGARRCPDGAEQLPLAPSIEGGAAAALCVAGPRVRRHFPPPLLILVQAGQISPAPVWDTRVVDAGGGEAIHTATIWVTYPSYGYIDQPPEIRDRSRWAVLGQRQDAIWSGKLCKMHPSARRQRSVGCLNLSLEGTHSR